MLMLHPFCIGIMQTVTIPGANSWRVPTSQGTQDLYYFREATLSDNTPPYKAVKVCKDLFHLQTCIQKHTHFSSFCISLETPVLQVMFTRQPVYRS